MSETEKKRLLRDVATAASLVRDVARNSEAGTVAVCTPYGQAVIHLDDNGADVKLPEGATVHVRFGLG